MDLTTQSPPMAPFVQFRTCHHGAEREVPHQEQTDSSLPISCLHLGQSIARAIIFLLLPAPGIRAGIRLTQLFFDYSRTGSLTARKGRYRDREQTRSLSEFLAHVQAERRIDTCCSRNFITTDLFVGCVS